MSRNPYVELMKYRLSAMVAFTTLTAGIISSGGLDPAVLLSTLGVFILAAGTSALNQWQEVPEDGLMRRTAGRPLPTGRLTRPQAFLFSLALIAGGLGILYMGISADACLLGVMAMIWYNAIYTPFKKISAFAALPGGVVGAIPPLIGWHAGGGSLIDPGAYGLAFFFFMWQVPHFWLLVLLFGKEYEQAGFRSLTQEFSMASIRRLIAIWLAATGVSGLMLLESGVVRTTLGGALIALLSFGLVIKVIRELMTAESPAPYRYAFHSVNMYALLLLVLISIDRLVEKYYL